MANQGNELSLLNRQINACQSNIVIAIGEWKKPCLHDRYQQMESWLTKSVYLQVKNGWRQIQGIVSEFVESNSYYH